MSMDGIVSAGAWMSRSSLEEPAAAATRSVPPDFAVPAAALGDELAVLSLLPHAAASGPKAAPRPTTAAPFST